MTFNNLPSSALTPIFNTVRSQFQGDLAERLNVEQMFTLIDGVLPFEACLYHQVLPLFVDGNRLNLGMVSSNDLAATDYVRRMVSYMNYSIVTHRISSTTLQASLSAYLNYASVKRAQPTLLHLSAPAHLGESSDREAPWRSPAKPFDQGDRQTFILDETNRPPDGILDATVQNIQLKDLSEDLSPEPNLRLKDLRSPDERQMEEAPEIMPPPAQEAADPIRAVEAELTQFQAIAPDPPPERRDQPGLSPPAAKPIPLLCIHAPHLHQSIEQLGSHLSPQELLQELLARVLESGIGRLYFERQKQGGKVLWSQNGVLRSVIEDLEPRYCQDLIDELRGLMQGALTVAASAEKSVQHLEIERIYQSERLLLRCRFIQGTHGEEATLQVLRGAALKFYEQQQLARLGHDAVKIAKQLQYKLDEIRSYAIAEPEFTQTRLRTLTELRQMLTMISNQIRDLQSTQDFSDP
jgi:hypothetical protein